jgi:hypothetical protein
MELFGDVFSKGVAMLFPQDKGAPAEPPWSRTGSPLLPRASRAASPSPSRLSRSASPSRLSRAGSSPPMRHSRMSGRSPSPAPLFQHEKFPQLDGKYGTDERAIIAAIDLYFDSQRQGAEGSESLSQLLAPGTCVRSVGDVVLLSELVVSRSNLKKAAVTHRARGAVLLDAAERVEAEPLAAKFFPGGDSALVVCEASSIVSGDGGSAEDIASYSFMLERNRQGPQPWRIAHISRSAASVVAHQASGVSRPTDMLIESEPKAATRFGPTEDAIAACKTQSEAFGELASALDLDAFLETVTGDFFLVSPTGELQNSAGIPSSPSHRRVASPAPAARDASFHRVSPSSHRDVLFVQASRSS